AQPEKSDRALAKQAGVDHKTIAKARRKAESTGESSPVEKRVGADGKARKRPVRMKATKPERAATRKKADERETALTAEFEQTAAELIALNRDIARRVHNLLWRDDKNRLLCALARQLGCDGYGEV